MAKTPGSLLPTMRAAMPLAFEGLEYGAARRRLRRDAHGRGDRLLVEVFFGRDEHFFVLEKD